MIRPLLMSTFILASAAHAEYNEGLEKSLCKQRPELCRQQAKPQPLPQKKQATSGPGWELIEGDRQIDIMSYLAQVALSTTYKNCRLDLYPNTNTKVLWVHGRNTYLNPDGFLPITKTLELNLNSGRPLFRLEGPTYKTKAYDIKPDNPEYKRFEMLIATNRDHTQIESIVYTEYQIQQNSYYPTLNNTPFKEGEPLDKPVPVDLITTESKSVTQTISCDAN